MFLEQELNRLQLKEEAEEGCEKGEAKVQSGGRRKSKHAPPPPLRLDASCSSLSSPATSPTGSSLSSLDSAFSQYSDYTSSNGVNPSAEPAPLSPLFPGRSPRGSPPQREALLPRTNQAPSHPHGLHPNTWLKKDRRLSLKQPENGHMDEDTGGRNPKSNSSSVCIQGAVMTNGQRRSSSPPSYQQALLQLQRSRSPFYKGTEKPLTVRELRQLHDQVCTYRPPPSAPPNTPKPHPGSEVTHAPAGSDCVQPPQGVFYGQSSTTLVLQRQKCHSLTPAVDGQNGRKTLPLPRRASEPTKIGASVSLTLDRPPKGHSQDGGLRVTAVEPSHSPSSEPHFCLSPSATQTVRDYFSSQGQADADACLRRSQEVALAIVQGKREWQSRRCSDPHMDEFDQLFFAEESYV